MRYSRSFIPTTKETPNDATLPSHQFLVRAGFISTSGSGLYNYLPLGNIVLDNIRKVVKEELDKAGAQEVQLSFVTPIEFWENSGRATKMGLEMLRIKDRKNNGFVLSPTNEEAMVELVKNRVTSYKDLPLNLYQINTKFRDEARPRFGLMRGREFLMKDGYSFHADSEDMKREFALMEETYTKIFTRLGLDFRIVEADSGAIGGTGSKEFHVLANSGEDTIVVCDRCNYGANIEAAKREPRKVADKKSLTSGKVHTPSTKTIDELSAFLGINPSQTIKAVVKKAIYEEGQKVAVFFVRGDDELEETKACNSVNALELTDISEEEIASVGLVVGYIGITNLPSTIVFKVDSELKNEKEMVCGANEENYHLAGVECTFDESDFFDLIAVSEGDTCGCCGGKLSYTKGIEAGHIFQLGDKYSKALGANFLDNNGKSKPFEMGTYGIGVSRLIAAVIEQSHDEKGCVWPLNVAPYECVIIASNVKDEEQMNFATSLYEELVSKGVRALFDDRNERYGVKMADFELIGIPYGIVVGKNLVEGNVELVTRKGLVKEVVEAKSVLSSFLSVRGN